MTSDVRITPQPRCRRCWLWIEGGFSLVSAIFLLVVLSALGAAMVNIFTVHQASSAMDVQGARAYQAARAGIEWGLYQQLRLGSCASTTSFALPSGTTLSSFTVSVECVKTAGSTTALDHYTVTSTACNQASPACPPTTLGNNPDYVQRVMTVQF